MAAGPLTRRAYKLYSQRDTFPAFNIPIICLPASIDNNLPGSELSIGADTALNSIVEVLDKIKQSAVATRRCFVVEVMGGYCGYLALMSGLASGAERVYLNEEGVKLSDLEADLNQMIDEFQHGKRLSLVIRNEKANPLYTTNFMSALFEEEGHRSLRCAQMPSWDICSRAAIHRHSTASRPPAWQRAVSSS